MIAFMDNGARKLLGIETILEVYWYGTFIRMQVLNDGWYMCYDYQKGRVDGVPDWTRGRR